MANERYSENLVLKEMGVDLGENDFGFVFPQGEVDNFDKIEKCLKEMGGKPAICSLDDYETVGSGRAKPEYIVTFNKDKNTIILVECKKSIKEHESSEKNMPQKYAVDGALFYAKHLKDDYNVVAVAVSGTSKENVKVNTFYWKKGFEDYQELKKAKDTILEPLNYLNLVEGKKLERKFSLQEIRELSQIMHEKLRQIKISEKDKPIFIAGMLIALQNADFRNTWNNINSFNSLVKLMIDSIEETLDNSDIKREKIEAIKSSFRRIKSNEKIKSIPLGENGSLAWFIEQLEMRILPMMNHYEYTEDALSVFYHEFIKYSSTDGKGLGIVLTPKHKSLIEMKQLERILAEKLLKISAIKLQPDIPFIWASGWNSPIYTDNRKTLSYPEIRNFIKVELTRLIMENFSDAEVVAGVATGAIAQGALVADTMGVPYIYVRSSPKDHGLENLIEGNLKSGQKVVVIEDLISTGGSSLKAVEAIRKAGAEVVGMVAIFTYEFPVAAEHFKKAGVKLLTLSNYSAMLEAAVATNYIKDSDLATLKEWRKSPSTWVPNKPIE